MSSCCFSLSPSRSLFQGASNTARHGPTWQNPADHQAFHISKISSFGSLKELKSPTALLAVMHSSPPLLPSQIPFQFCWTEGRGKVRQPTRLLGYCRGHKPTRIKAGYICQVIEPISCPAQFSGPWHIPLCFIYRSWVELGAIHSGHWDPAALQVTCRLVWSYTCKDRLV